MPWIIGIDEAGYGPNLGPFVMTSVACRVPGTLTGADLWKVLRTAVRRHREPDDGRLIIEDSKLLHAGNNAFRDLERNVLPVLSDWCSGGSLGLVDYLKRACPDAQEDLAAECWFAGTSTLPAEAKPEEYHATADRFVETCKQAEVVWGFVRSEVVCPRRFNGLLRKWGSKGAVLSLSLVELVRWNHAQGDEEEAMYFYVDKHGGRNTYASALQYALPEGMVLAHEEGRGRSVYSVAGLKRTLQLTFEPRADSSHLCVALASMFSKYLREILMREFNRFWQTHLPDLKPTAGYPGDSARYYAEIKPIAKRLGIPEASLWRCK